jgi:predicted O-methyltransferase YrrM
MISPDFLKNCFRFFQLREPREDGRKTRPQAHADNTLLTTPVQPPVVSDEFAAASSPPADGIHVNELRKFVPDGHFYSPIPAAADLVRYIDLALPEIDEETANEKRQLELAETFKAFYKELPFSADASSDNRYYLNNGAFNYFDGIILYSFIRLLKPRKIVEVGSGFSSAAMIDTCERFLHGATEITFIEPYPTTLNNCLRPEDRGRYTVIESNVQDVPLEVFQRLGKNDILFIDSSHVGKFGSDVNHLLFKVLPLLQDGVVIHFHDIFRHFDYPEEWLKEGRAWNEGYLLKAFLAFNRNYQIQFFNDWFAHRHWEYLERNLPLCTVQPEGSPFKNSGVSLWVRKVGQDGTA